MIVVGLAMKRFCKKKLLHKLLSLKGIWFHIVGLVCLAWFLIRVTPAPYRTQYPCQRISIPIAMAYIAFWSVLFVGLSGWIRRAKYKIQKTVPTFIVACIVLFTITGAVFAGISLMNTSTSTSWTPIPNQPIGTPQGIHPGCVVWVWDPNATENELNGFWWMSKNNNQEVIDTMMTNGVKTLTGNNNLTEAWDTIFTFYNQIHGYGTYSYQPGEKIAIKINLNNCWVYQQNPYFKYDNERDASPQVVKALLRQLVNVVGIPQEDITIFDASRQMANWFYYRVYYQQYPALPLIPEFPGIHYADLEGGVAGREKVEPSTVKVWFADGTDFTRTMPTCVTEAKYLINMPLLKAHPIADVTLSGKNLFGTFIEPVVDVHPYLESGLVMGNPAPQVDLLAFEQLGGKTLLYIGDGLYATKIDHRTIDKFHMYPFNNDWTNSLFFSQDPVAIDSVMYDFLKTEGTNPTEGSQSYLHQAAEPPVHVYDPEHDGTFLDHSLGVHEHWNTSVNIFSPDRYVGPSHNGIDFIAVGKEHASSAVVISQPQEKHVYLFGEEKNKTFVSLVFGSINVSADVNGVSDPVEKVEFYLDGKLQFTDNEAPYSWSWTKRSFSRHTIKVIAYYDGQELGDTMKVWKFF